MPHSDSNLINESQGLDVAQQSKPRPLVLAFFHNHPKTVQAPSLAQKSRREDARLSPPDTSKRASPAFSAISPANLPDPPRLRQSLAGCETSQPRNLPTARDEWQSKTSRRRTAQTTVGRLLLGWGEHPPVDVPETVGASLMLNTSPKAHCIFAVETRQPPAWALPADGPPRAYEDHDGEWDCLAMQHFPFAVSITQLSFQPRLGVRFASFSDALSVARRSALFPMTPATSLGPGLSNPATDAYL